MPFACEVGKTNPFAISSGKSQHHAVAIVVKTYERVVAEGKADILRFGVRNERVAGIVNLHTEEIEVRRVSRLLVVLVIYGLLEILLRECERVYVIPRLLSLHPNVRAKRSHYVLDVHRSVVSDDEVLSHAVHGCGNNRTEEHLKARVDTIIIMI